MLKNVIFLLSVLILFIVHSETGKPVETEFAESAFMSSNRDGDLLSEAVLKEQLDEKSLTIRPTEIPVHRPRRGISVYDNLIKEVSRREGYDWRFLSAIAYHESRFNAEIVSSRGAQGLMQIMPSVAKAFDVPNEQLTIPEVNVTLGAKLLTRIEKSLGFSANVKQDDKMKIILASYNGGIGHVTDARRLAAKYGYNPDSWEDVSYFLELKANPEFHQDEVVKCGSFKGSKQTLAFVDNVMSKYDSYRNQVPN